MDIFFSDRTGQVTKGPVWFYKSKSISFHFQSFHFQIIPGAQIVIFLVKIGMKLPFTMKNKSKNTNFKFEFKTYLIFAPRKERFWFLKKNPSQNFFFVIRLWFSFKNNKHTNVILFGIFWKVKNTDQNNICASIVF